MLNLDKPIIDMLKSRAGTVISLYEVYYQTETLPICFCSDSKTLEYKGKKYIPQAVKHSDISYKTDGSLDDVTLTIGNAEKQMQYYIERFDLLCKRVVIKHVYINTFGVIAGDLSASFFIKAIRVTNTLANFTLSVGFDFFKITAPCRRILARFCCHSFRDCCCCYSGNDNSCSKTFEECKRKGNVANFGGFPGVKNERLYF